MLIKFSLSYANLYLHWTIDSKVTHFEILCNEGAPHGWYTGYPTLAPMVFNTQPQLQTMVDRPLCKKIKAGVEMEKSFNFTWLFKHLIVLHCTAYIYGVKHFNFLQAQYFALDDCRSSTKTLLNRTHTPLDYRAKVCGARQPHSAPGLGKRAAVPYHNRYGAAMFSPQYNAALQVCLQRFLAHFLFNKSAPLFDINPIHANSLNSREILQMCNAKNSFILAVCQLKLPLFQWQSMGKIHSSTYSPFFLVSQMLLTTNPTQACSPSKPLNLPFKVC